MITIDDGDDNYVGGDDGFRWSIKIIIIGSSLLVLIVFVSAIIIIFVVVVDIFLINPSLRKFIP